MVRNNEFAKCFDEPTAEALGKLKFVPPITNHKAFVSLEGAERIKADEEN